MKLQLSGARENALNYLENAYIAPSGPMVVDEMNQKREHNSMMIKILFALNDLEFYDIKNQKNAKEMWEKFILMYGGDENVLRAKFKSIRGKYDDTK